MGDQNQARVPVRNHLPDIILRRIFAYLSARDSLAASQTCRHWRSVGLETRQYLEHLRISDFYIELINERRFLESPIFHRREDLGHLILIKTNYMQKLLQWLGDLFPNVAELIFRNYIKRGIPSNDAVPHPSYYDVFIIDEIMILIGKLWPNMEMLDISGQIVDVDCLNELKKWKNFREIRISGCDLSYNMLKAPYVVVESLERTFSKCQLVALRMSNLHFGFDVDVSRLTSFKALGNKGLITAWLNYFVQNAVNLESFMIDCKYLHNETVVLIGRLSKLRSLVLRNCIHVTDFSPLGNLKELNTIVVDYNDKGTEDQMCTIISGSTKWRCVIFNETIESIGNNFLFHFADHCLKYSCPVVHFELNTEKKEFPFVYHDWTMPNADIEGMEAVLKACPRLETFGLCSRYIDDECLFKVVEWCPRISKIIFDHSWLTDDGVIDFYEAFRRAQFDQFGNAGYIFIDVRSSYCTPELVKRANALYGGSICIHV